MSWITKDKPALVLAPMEGVTDAPMRALLTERPGFTHCVSEFMRISENVPPAKVFRAHAPEFFHNSKTPSGIPVFFQLLGGNAQRLAESAQLAIKLGAIGIDLNFGCPAPTVNRHDGGATLLKFPERIFEITQAVRQAVPRAHPVSVKLRLGWDSQEPIYLNAQKAVDAGASWITIHGRTREAGYRPPAYWGPIGELHKTLPVPVIANGDIWTLDDFRRCRDETGCVHYMLGRGAVSNPFLATRVAQELGLLPQTGACENLPSRQQWQLLIDRLVSLSATDSRKEEYALRRVKQWMKMVNSRMPTPFYDQMKVLKNLNELRPFLKG